MKTALELARRGLGNVWPNPAVGCILVRNDRIVGRGWTQPGGRPHAEIEALNRARKTAQGATAYVTLEPCNHCGHTPSCSAALISAGIKRVVIALEDPDSRTIGGGISRLRSAGIQVKVGLFKTEAAEINRGFFMRIMEKRPVFTVKTATSLDAKIATNKGKSQWITSDKARYFNNYLRAVHDAIMIGSNTAMTDNPSLTCRIPGLESRSPVRIILDGRLRLPLTSNLVRSARDVPVWVITRNDTSEDQCKMIKDQGVKIFTVAPQAHNTGLNLHKIAALLASRGLTRILVEGGAKLTASLIKTKLVDELVWCRSGRLIGGDGLSAIDTLGVDKLDTTPYLHACERKIFSPDVVEIYKIID